LEDCDILGTTSSISQTVSTGAGSAFYGLQVFYNIHAHSAFTSVKCTLSATRSNGDVRTTMYPIALGASNPWNMHQPWFLASGTWTTVMRSVSGSTTIAKLRALFLTNIAIFGRCDYEKSMGKGILGIWVVCCDLPFSSFRLFVFRFSFRPPLLHSVSVSFSIHDHPKYVGVSLIEPFCNNVSKSRVSEALGKRKSLVWFFS
jgi:hypothetical protein